MTDILEAIGLYGGMAFLLVIVVGGYIALHFTALHLFVAALTVLVLLETENHAWLGAYMVVLVIGYVVGFFMEFGQDIGTWRARRRDC